MPVPKTTQVVEKETETPADPEIPEDGDGEGQQGEEENLQDFETWLGEQPENVQEAYNTHVHGLQSALRKERDARKTLQKQLKQLGQSSRDGEDISEQLEEISTELEEMQTRNDFYVEAAKRGIKYLDVAYLTARQADAIDRRGRVDWEALEEQYPVIFKVVRKRLPKGRGGSGTGGDNPAQKPSDGDMNTWIRRQAGRST